MIAVPIAAVLLLMIIVLEFYMFFGDKTYFGISKEEKPLAVAVMLPFIVPLGKFVIQGFISSAVPLEKALQKQYDRLGISEYDAERLVDGGALFRTNIVLTDGYIFDFGKTLVYSVSEITRVYVESNDRNSRMNTDDDYYTIYANTSSLGKVILAWYDHEIRTDAEKFHKEADILKEYLLNSGCTAVINI